MVNGKIYEVEQLKQVTGSVIVAKNEKTRAFLEGLNEKQREPELRCVYYKMRVEGPVDQVWKSGTRGVKALP